MRCNLCSKRKAKRLCPALNSEICPQCCGEKRVIEIHCPESCEYLQSGRRREIGQAYSRHLSFSDPTRGARHMHVLSEHEDVIAHLEFLIAEQRRCSHDLTDRDAAEALDLLLDTLRTEERGILYERTSNNLRIDNLRRALHEWIRTRRYPRDAAEERLRLEDAISCVDLVRTMAGSYMAAGAGPQGYVDFVARNAPRAERPAGGGGIIIPGR